MSAAVLDRLRELFVVADGAAPATRVAERAVPATLVALVAREDAAVVGAALGLAAAAALRAPCAVACMWGGDAPSPRGGPAPAGARRLRDRMAARGLAAVARGRLVTVALPDADGEARVAAERALAAAGEAPVVIVLAGPRPPALDPLLAGVDRVVLVPPHDALPHVEEARGHRRGAPRPLDVRAAPPAAVERRAGADDLRACGRAGAARGRDGRAGRRPWVTACAATSAARRWCSCSA